MYIYDKRNKQFFIYNNKQNAKRLKNLLKSFQVNQPFNHFDEQTPLHLAIFGGIFHSLFS